jgi:hypothetical protein
MGSHNKLLLIDVHSSLQNFENDSLSFYRSHVHYLQLIIHKRMVNWSVPFKHLNNIFGVLSIINKMIGAQYCHLQSLRIITLCPYFYKVLSILCTDRLSSSLEFSCSESFKSPCCRCSDSTPTRNLFQTSTGSCLSTSAKKSCC